MAKENLIKVILAVSTKVVDGNRKALKKAGEVIEVTKAQKADYIKRGIVKDNSEVKASPAVNKELEVAKAAIVKLDAEIVELKAATPAVVGDAELLSTIEKLEALVVEGHNTPKNNNFKAWDEYLASKVVKPDLLGAQE